MKLTCPHGKAMKIANALGLVYYVHTDDEGDCSVMNKFNSSSERALSQMVAGRDIKRDDPLMFAALRNSRPARFRYFKWLSKLQGRELRQGILDLWSIMGMNHRAKDILEREFSDEFGPDGIDTLNEAVPTVTFYMRRNAEKVKPKLRIRNLREDALIGSVDAIRDELTSAERRKEAALRRAASMVDDPEVGLKGGMWH